MPLYIYRLPRVLSLLDWPEQSFQKPSLGGIIRVLEEHPTPFPKCERCGIQVSQWRLNDRHYESENANWERHHGSTVIPYSADLGQVGSLSISIPSPYLHWRPYPNF